MSVHKRPHIEKKILIGVLIAAGFFLVAGAVLGLWSAKEMRQQVLVQFNEQQLIIARDVRDSIERCLASVIQEMKLLADSLSAMGAFDPAGAQLQIQQSLERTQERGIRKIEAIDVESLKTYIFIPYSHWAVRKISDIRAYEGVGRQEDSMRPGIIQDDMNLKLFVRIFQTSQSCLVFTLDTVAFLAPFLKNIHSGRTGYAWVMDENGRMLFHPESGFIGKNTFEMIEGEFPDPGENHNAGRSELLFNRPEGTGFYYSGWHQGMGGKIQKLSAHCSITISENIPLRWVVAVTAPVSEIIKDVRNQYLWMFLLQGLIVVLIVLSASTIIYFQVRWTHSMEGEVEQRTLALKTSEEKYRSLVESAEDLIFTVDKKGRFQSLNSYTMRFFGAAGRDFYNQPMAELFGAELKEKLMAQIARVFRSCRSIRQEIDLSNRRKPLWLSSNCVPIVNESCQVDAVLCIARDITENKQLERQLISSEKLASIGTLAAGVAHEINNPLGIMLGYCDLLLLNAELGTQEYQDLKTIERHGFHCKRIVEDLLRFSRTNTNREAYADLNQCIREIVQFVEHVLEINHITSKVILADYLPEVCGDSRQLQQVFLNLINNSVAAMSDGGSIEITSYFEEGTKRAVVDFKDTGVGIPKEFQDRIFEPFYTTKPEGEGTGLGLSISYGIIAGYGGAMSFVSHTQDSLEAPRGTTFTVKLLTRSQEES